MTKSFCILCAFPVAFAVKRFNRKENTKFVARTEGIPGCLQSFEFRVAETTVFVPKDFTKKMLDACESIVDIIIDPRFKELTKNAIPKNLQVPGENDHSHFIAFDFGVCINEAGEYEPQLIEMQGFPTLFAYEVVIDDIFRKHFAIPD